MKIRFGILIPALLITGTVTWLIINKVKKNKLYKKLLEDLQTGEGSGDAQQSIGSLTKKGGGLDPTYYNTVPNDMNKKLRSSADIKYIIKKLHDSIHGFLGSSDEEAIIELFKKMRAKTETSQIADNYQKVYKISLADDLKKIDTTGYLGYQIGESDLQKVVDIINSLPDK
jgi:hypothetical protein